MDPRQTHFASARHPGGFAVALTIAFAVVFTLGVVIGYNSVYRNISVAMLTPTASQL
jgi:hypothetical protein